MGHQAKEDGRIDSLVRQKFDGVFGNRREEARGEFFALNGNDADRWVFRYGSP